MLAKKKKQKVREEKTKGGAAMLEFSLAWHAFVENQTNVWPD
jgi:hypothetical protein